MTLCSHASPVVTPISAVPPSCLPNRRWRVNVCQSRRLCVTPFARLHLGPPRGHLCASSRYVLRGVAAPCASLISLPTRDRGCMCVAWVCGGASRLQLSITSGSPQLIVSAWSQSPVRRLALQLWDPSGARCISATEGNRPFVSAANWLLWVGCASLLLDQLLYNVIYRVHRPVVGALQGATVPCLIVSPCVCFC